MIKKYLIALLLMTVSIFAITTVYANAKEESKAPVIEEMKVLTPNVSAGETIKVQVKVSDDSKKIKTIRTTFLSPNKKDSIFIELNIKDSDPTKNMYTLESEKVQSKFETGKWHAGMIQIKDVTGNFTNYTKARPGNIDYNALQFDLVAKNTETVEKSNSEKDNFKALKSLTNIKINHEFSYTFDTDIANSTFTKHNIYILDKNEKKVPLLFVVDRATNRKKSTITFTPVDPFQKNSQYTLYIKDIVGKNGKIIKQNTKREFTTVK